MSNQNGKYIIIASLILLVLIGLALYFAFRGGANNNSGSLGGIFGGGGGLPDTGGGNQPGSGGGTGLPNNGGLPGGLSESEAKKLVQLTKDPVLGPAVSERGDKIMYFKRGTGNLFQIDFIAAGAEEKIFNKTLKNIIGAQWSFSKKYAVITTLNDDTAKTWWLNRTGTSTILTGEFQNSPLSMGFAPAEDKIASVVKTGSVWSVITSKPDNTGQKNIYSTQIPDFEISWVDKNTLSLKTRSSAFAPSLFAVLPATGGNLSVLSSEKMGFDILWNPQGTRYVALETFTSGRKIKMTFENRALSAGSNNFSLQTLPEKCAFSKKDPAILYCGVPRTLGAEPLPDAWWQGKVAFDDELWKINTQTGESAMLLRSSGFDFVNILPSPNEDYIFFINKKDSTLWSLRTI